MSMQFCRLCLGDEEVVNIFDKRLENSEDFTKCVLITTGVQICQNDSITKSVCNKCCNIIIYINKYRQNALAIDKFLKEYATQTLVTPPLYKSEMTKFKNEFFKLLMAKVNEQSVNKDSEFHPVIKQIIEICLNVNYSEILRDLYLNNEAEEATPDNGDEALSNSSSERIAKNFQLPTDQTTTSSISKVEPFDSYDTSDESETEDPLNSSLVYVSNVYDSENSLTSYSEVSVNPAKKGKISQPNHGDINNRKFKNNNFSRPLSFDKTTNELESSFEVESIYNKEKVLATACEHVNKGKILNQNLGTGLNCYKTNIESETKVISPESVSQTIFKENEKKKTQLETALSSVNRDLMVSPKHSEKKAIFDCSHCDKKFRNRRQLNCHKREHKKRMSCEYLFYGNKRRNKCDQDETISKLLETSMNKLPNFSQIENNGAESSRSTYKEENYINFERKVEPERTMTRENMISLEDLPCQYHKSFSCSIGSNSKCSTGNEQVFLVPDTNVRCKSEATTSDIYETDHFNDDLYNTVSKTIPPTANIELAESIISSTNTIGGYSLLQSIKVEPAFYCNPCSKSFDSEWKLKCHQRFHKCCPVCNAIFKSEKTLKLHQKKICFKGIQGNPPNLLLSRVDEGINIYANSKASENA